MSEEQDINNNEAGLLQALAEQAPAENFSVKSGEALAPEATKASKERGSTTGIR